METSTTNKPIAETTDSVSDSTTLQETTVQFIVTDTTVSDSVAVADETDNRDADLNVLFDTACSTSSNSSAEITPRHSRTPEGEFNLSFKTTKHGLDVKELGAKIILLSEGSGSGGMPKLPSPVSKSPTTQSNTIALSSSVYPLPTSATTKTSATQIQPSLFASPRLQPKETYYSPAHSPQRATSTRVQLLREFSIEIAQSQDVTTTASAAAATLQQPTRSHTPRQPQQLQRSISSMRIIRQPDTHESGSVIQQQKSPISIKGTENETTKNTSPSALLSAAVQYKLCSCFAVAQRVLLASQEPCLTCKMKIIGGFMVVQLTLLYSPITSNNNLKIQLLIRSMCVTCAQRYCIAGITTTQALMRVYKPFAAQRLLSALEPIVLRYQLEHGKAVCNERPHPNSTMKCTNCSCVVNIGTHHSGLLIKHDDTHEYSLAPCCSITCESRARQALTHFCEQPIASDNWTAINTGDACYDFPWYTRLTIMESRLYDDLCTGHLKLPAPTLIHCTCSNAACKVCTMKRGNTLLRTAAFGDTGHNLWMIALLSALFEQSLCSEVLASNDEMHCVVCRMPSSGVCEGCRFVRVCEACSESSIYKAHTTKCQKNAIEQWSKIFFR